MLAETSERINSMELVRSELTIQERHLVRRLELIDDFQKEVNFIYGFQNQRRSPIVILGHVSSNMWGVVGGIDSADAKYGRSRAENYLPMAFAWICALFSSLDAHLSQVIWFKYPDKCPYCKAMVCACPAAARPEADANRTLLDELRTGGPPAHAPRKPFSYYRAMFHRIYGERNEQAGRKHICLYALSKVHRVNDALLRLRSLEQLRDVDILHLELADLVAWFFALLDLHGRDYAFEEAFALRFEEGCPYCHQESCKCPEVQHEIRLAAWREFD
jgi:hypothetical protein